MKQPWFKPWGWIYYPVSVTGWVLTVLAILFLLQVWVAVDGNAHSGTDTLYGIFPYWVPAAGVWLWIASKTSKSKK